ncbi:MAG: transglutaminase-like domain-containing protein [Alphaproteobacteria bacterium]|nr:transglutaminase-like domain-containing protein [Alphaproteobacteria bacterium]
MINMHKLLLLAAALFFVLPPVFAKEPPLIRQNSVNRQLILRRALNVPQAISKNERSVAIYLTKPFDNKIEKMQAIAYWIATHIAYDSYKFNNAPNLKNMSYHYDVFKARTGICLDFAKLFQEMSMYAGIRGVRIVSGYVVTTKNLQKQYRPQQLGTGHAWNAVNLNGYTYYIDTTWMATQHVATKGNSKFNQWNHKQEILKRLRTNTAAKTIANIRYYYFLFTPQDEVRKFGEHHFVVSSD